MEPPMSNFEIYGLTTSATQLFGLLAAWQMHYERAERQLLAANMERQRHWTNEGCHFWPSMGFTMANIYFMMVNNWLIMVNNW